MRSLPTAAGRWSLLPPSGEENIDVEKYAHQLLSRYGIVFRDLLVRESGLPPWRELLWVFRRLEARGIIRGGRFVRGFVGEQYALPEAVQQLRLFRDEPGLVEIVRIAATDPLNLVGITSPGPKVPAVVGNYILYRNGLPVASMESGVIIHRHPLIEGEHVDDKLHFHAPKKIDDQLGLALR